MIRTQNKPIALYLVLLLSLLSNLYLIKILSKGRVGNRIRFEESGHQLYSFSSTGLNQVSITFTAYNPINYIFITVSANCKYCHDVLKIFQQDDFSDYSNLEIYAITSDAKIKDDEIMNKAKVSVLNITNDDMIQFGRTYPAILLVNGKGQVLSKIDGYSQTITNQLVYLIDEKIISSYKSKQN